MTVTAPRPLIRRYARLVVRHPWVVLAAVTFATVALGLGVSRVHVEVDPDRQLPQDHPYIRSLNEIHRLFGDKNLVMIGLHPTLGDPFNPRFLETVRSITERIAQLPGIVAPLLQSIASPNIKYITNSNTGLIVEPLMPELPFPPGIGAIMKARVFADSSYRGTIVSFDESSLAIYATFELTPELPGYVHVHRAVVSILDDASDGTFTYSLSGPVIIASTLSLYASQVAYFFPIALVVIGLVHYHAFRTWQAVFLPLTTGLLAVIWALGLMGHLGVAIDPFNSTTPVLILAVGAGHAVQILKRYYEEQLRLEDNHSAIVESVARVGSVMIAAGAIAILSFLSLATLGTDSMRTFGLFTAFGILSSMAIELTTIPALRSILPAPEHSLKSYNANTNLYVDKALAYAAQRLATRRTAKQVLFVYLLIIAASIALARRIEVDTSFKRTFAEADAVRKHDDLLNSLFGGTNVLLFTIEGPKEGAIAEPFALRAIDRFQRRIESLPGVGKVVSIVDTLRYLHHAINPTSDPDELPATFELITQYLFLYTLSGGNDLSSRLTLDNRTTKIVTMLREDSTRYGERTIARAKDIAAEELPNGYQMRVAGTLASNAALTETMVRGKLLNVIQIALLTVAIASLVLRSLLGGLLVVAPLAIAVIINFGVMGAMRLPLDISSAVVTAMAVGIGADYAVYFLFRLREEYRLDQSLEDALGRAMLTSGKAVLFVSSAIALVFAVLCLSGFRIFVQLGSLVGLAMVTSSLATLLVLPALLTLISQTPWIHTLLETSGDGSAAGTGSSRQAGSVQ